MCASTKLDFLVDVIEERVVHGGPRGNPRLCVCVGVCAGVSVDRLGGFVCVRVSVDRLGRRNTRDFWLAARSKICSSVSMDEWLAGCLPACPPTKI